MTYTDNRELEGRIFHIAKEYGVPLFEKDVAVEKRIESLFRVSLLFNKELLLLPNKLHVENEPFRDRSDIRISGPSEFRAGRNFNFFYKSKCFQCYTCKANIHLNL